MPQKKGPPVSTGPPSLYDICMERILDYTLEVSENFEYQYGKQPITFPERLGSDILNKAEMTPFRVRKSKVHWLPYLTTCFCMRILKK